ncbi:MAG: hypothetical protein JWN15_2468, partial [Firmicutes bacterium]|nr:hypothetical protein [Bacillota bacterium]
MSREEPRPSADRADQVEAVWKRFREGR